LKRFKEIMKNSILDTPLLRHSKPWWQPFLSLFVTLYGILVLGWNLQPIVVLFWWEVILMVGAALIRMLFALDSKAFFDNLMHKIILLIGGGVMSCAMIMLAVTFSFKAFEGGLQSEGFDSIPAQTRILTISYVLGLIFHFFANGRYKTASPIGELMRTLVHLLVLLALLMVLTMHLIPSYPQLNQAKWVGVAVVVVKFVVDWLFTQFDKTVESGKTEIP
jgi:hypothetical protein